MSMNPFQWHFLRPHLSQQNYSTQSNLGTGASLGIDGGVPKCGAFPALFYSSPVGFISRRRYV